MNIGLIGLDTSHVIAFARILNDSQCDDFIKGARITAGFPGGSHDFELSAARVDGYTRKLAEDYGVKMVRSPEAVAEQCDAILLTSVDGRVHLKQFSRIVPFRKPTYVDKPFAVSSRHARQISEIAERYGVPLMSASPLRFSEALASALADQSGGIITGADFAGPMPMQSTQPGFFWYGVHSAEALYSVLGRGCSEVSVTTSEAYDLAVGLWGDGRIGSIRGFRGPGYFFRGVLPRNNEIKFLDLNAGAKSMHFHLLSAIIEFFRSGKSPVPLSESVEVIRFLEAANESRSSGKRVTL